MLFNKQVSLYSKLWSREGDTARGGRDRLVGLLQPCRGPDFDLGHTCPGVSCCRSQEISPAAPPTNARCAANRGTATAGRAGASREGSRAFRPRRTWPRSSQKAPQDGIHHMANRPQGVACRNRLRRREIIEHRALPGVVSAHGVLPLVITKVEYTS
jgi:hypothetical protein